MDIKSNQENIFLNNTANNTNNNYSEKFKLAQALAKSGLIPKELLGENSSYKVFAILVYGEEFGLSPFVSLRNIRVIDGTPCMSADLMKSLMFMTKDIDVWEEGFIGRKAPDGRYIINVKDEKGIVTLDDDFGYRVYVKRKSIPIEVEITFTIRDARRAKLLVKNNWINYPQDMVRSRCVSKVSKIVFPEILSRVYTPEELEAGENELSITKYDNIPEITFSKKEKIENKIDEIKQENAEINIEDAIKNDINLTETEIETKDIQEKDLVLSEIKKAKEILTTPAPKDEIKVEEIKYITEIPEQIKNILISKNYDISKFKMIDGAVEDEIINNIIDLPAFTYYDSLFKKIKNKAMINKIKDFTKKIITLTIKKDEIDVFNKTLIDYIELTEQKNENN